MDYKHKAYIGVGSNVGDRAENCRKALAAVAASESCLLEIQSPLYETEPVELEDQDWFINGVARIRTGLEPEDLLAELQAIERAIGREPGGPKLVRGYLTLTSSFLTIRSYEQPSFNCHTRSCISDDLFCSPSATLHRNLYTRCFGKPYDQCCPV